MPKVVVALLLLCFISQCFSVSVSVSVTVFVSVLWGSMAARNELATNHHHHHHRAATSSSSSSSWRYIHAIILQIQRRLLPLIEMMDVELLLRLLLRGPQIPDQVGQTSWPGQAACLLLGQLVRVARCPASAAG